MTYKRKYILNANKTVPGRPQITKENPSRERPIRHIRMSDDEWKQVTEYAKLCHKRPSTFIRMRALGYEPMVPDPELKSQLAKIRHDIIAFSKRMAGMSDESRKLFLGEQENQIKWFNAVQLELNFIDDLRRRI